MANDNRNDDRKPGKSEWLTDRDRGAYEPVTDEELNGLRPLGESSVRDGAIAGVSDPVRGGNAAPHQRADDTTGGDDGPRRNPEVVEHAGTGDGGISVSGGAAGGETRHVDGAEIVRFMGPRDRLGRE
jgi:hypothetical protein